MLKLEVETGMHLSCMLRNCNPKANPKLQSMHQEFQLFTVETDKAAQEVLLTLKALVFIENFTMANGADTCQVRCNIKHFAVPTKDADRQ